jgi:mRNA interferase MazF
MKINKYEIWLANLNPSKGVEPGKTRPVVVIQSDLLNGLHPSTIVCPITSNVVKEAEILRVYINKEQLEKESDVLVDQMRAIDNKRLLKRLGKLNKEQLFKLKRNIGIVLDL